MCNLNEQGSRGHGEKKFEPTITQMPTVTTILCVTTTMDNTHTTMYIVAIRYR